MTQIESAKKGIITPEMKWVADKEEVAIQDLLENVALGRVEILKNHLHNIAPLGVGKGLRTKPSGNQPDQPDIQEVDEVQRDEVLPKCEMEKLPLLVIEEVAHGTKIVLLEFRRKQPAEEPGEWSLPAPAQMVEVVIGEVALVRGAVHDEKQRRQR